MLAFDRSGVETGLAGDPRGGLSWFSPDLSYLIGEISLKRPKEGGRTNSDELEYLELIRIYVI